MKGITVHRLIGPLLMLAIVLVLPAAFAASPDPPGTSVLSDTPASYGFAVMSDDAQNAPSPQADVGVIYNAIYTGTASTVPLNVQQTSTGAGGTDYDEHAVNETDVGATQAASSVISTNTATGYDLRRTNATQYATRSVLLATTTSHSARSHPLRC